MMEAGEGTAAVEIIKAVSKGGRAARQTPTLLALAMCCQLGDAATKTAAYKVLSEVLRIPTHLFEFLELSESTAARSCNSKFSTLLPRITTVPMGVFAVNEMSSTASSTTRFMNWS